MSQVQDTRTNGRAMAALLKFINFVERVGNMLPHPFWLFWVMAILLGIVSWSLAGTTVEIPNSDKDVTVQNLFSFDGLNFAVTSAFDNFAGFPPLAIVLVVLLGISVAEKSGILEALLRLTIVRLPKRWVTFAIAFSGMIAHIMGDAAYLVMIPLGALAFRAAGRHPMLGVMVSYVSVSAGFNASPLITPSDAIRSSLASAAAQTIAPEASITPAATYFFSASSSLVLALIITLVVELVLSKREDFRIVPGDVLDLDGPQSIHIEKHETRALITALVSAVVFVAIVILLLFVPNSPFIEPGQQLVQSVVFSEIGVFVSLLFTLIGSVYGFKTGKYKSFGDIPRAMIAGVAAMAPVLVLFFAVSQFLAYFTWTGLGSVLTVNGAALLQDLQAPHFLVLLIIILAIAFTNMIVTSGSAMWAIFAPILVPMMMYYGIRPEAAMVSFMIGDSVTNAITPMSAYFVLALGYVQKYKRDAGIGTLMAFTLPVSVSILIGWTAFYGLWYALGLPLGPGVPLR